MNLIGYLTMASAWMLWLFFSFNSITNPVEGAGSGWKMFRIMLFPTIALLSMAFMLGRGFQTGDSLFVEKYTCKMNRTDREIIIGNSEENSHLTLENPHAGASHVRIRLSDSGYYYIQNVSQGKNVDINGSYLNRPVVRTGDEIEIDGHQRIKISKINRQFPLGRSMRILVKKNRNHAGEAVTVSTLLNKRVALSIGRTHRAASGFNTLVIPGNQPKVIAYLTHEIPSPWLGINRYYLVVFMVVFLFSLALYLYLKNHFNGAVLLFMGVSLPYLSGFVSGSAELIILALFIPAILYCQKRRKTRWKPLSVLIVAFFGFLSVSPILIGVRGDFTLAAAGPDGENSIRIIRDQADFNLGEIEKKLAYGSENRLILGYTRYRLKVEREDLTLSPLDPEKIGGSDGFDAIISDLKGLEPGRRYIHLKYPHHFSPVANPSRASGNRIVIKDSAGNSLALSRQVNRSHYRFFIGFMVFILAFWLFWLADCYGFSAGKIKFFKLNLLSPPGMLIYSFIYFMLGTGYIMFGILSLQNNYFLKNFDKYRGSALPAFIALLFVLLVVSRYNRIFVLLHRLFNQKKFLVPALLGALLLVLGLFIRLFIFIGIGYLVFIGFIRLRKDLIYEYQNTHHQPLVLKQILERPISDLHRPEKQRVFFGLGKILYHQGWDYITFADLLLLLSLFFIVIQVFLGGELGVSVAGFFFLPIELAKILLTIYFADWVSRIDRGMRMGVTWIYALVLVPFLLLIVFLKDFSPLLVFAFVFFYHLIKIKKPAAFKILLGMAIFFVLAVSTLHISQYVMPFKVKPMGLVFSSFVLVPALILLLRIWLGKYRDRFRLTGRVMFTLGLILALLAGNLVFWQQDGSLPRVLGDRINSWLNPWNDYDLSYQYINSLWLMKGTGLMGDPSRTLAAAIHVPLIEQDLSFSLYVGVLGIFGVFLILLTLIVLMSGIHRLVLRHPGAQHRWHGYALEFLAVIFSAQFAFPALYAVGLLPIMSQPIPFLSYSNNMLLLFSLPYSWLTLVLINNLREK